MKNLVERLFEETVDLKAEYLERTKVWASEEFERINATTEQEIIDSRGYLSKSRFHPEGVMRHTKASDAYWSKIRRIKERGAEDYIAKMEDEAKRHYEDSIKKLANRIEKKDLDQSKLQLHSSRIKMNFETTITDGSKSVRAFTIIASGAIQRPHYRYLVK